MLGFNSIFGFQFFSWGNENLSLKCMGGSTVQPCCVAQGRFGKGAPYKDPEEMSVSSVPWTDGLGFSHGLCFTDNDFEYQRDVSFMPRIKKLYVRINI